MRSATFLYLAVFLFLSLLFRSSQAQTNMLKLTTFPEEWDPDRTMRGDSGEGPWLERKPQHSAGPNNQALYPPEHRIRLNGEDKLGARRQIFVGAV